MLDKIKEIIASVVAAIVEYYFGQSDSMQTNQQENILIP